LCMLNYPDGLKNGWTLTTRLMVMAPVLTDRADSPYSTHHGDSGSSCYLPLSKVLVGAILKYWFRL